MLRDKFITQGEVRETSAQNEVKQCWATSCGLLYAVFRCLKVLTFFCHCYSFCSMFLDRHHRRRRWIVGCVMVSIAVITMLLAPPPSVVSVVLFQDSLCMFRVVLSHTSGEANLNIICSWLFFHIGEHCSALR